MDGSTLHSVDNDVSSARWRGTEAYRLRFRNRFDFGKSAIPPNVHWAWYNLTRTAVIEQHFDHCRLLPHAFQAWQNLEMTKPWSVLKPSVRISVRQANLEALVRAMLTTLWALYGRPRSGPIRDRFLPRKPPSEFHVSERVITPTGRVCSQRAY
jgi:hypothetical protein